MNEQRNPRHRNFEDHYKKGESVKYLFPHNFKKFEQLLNIAQKIVAHSKIKKISFVKDNNPR